jgi:hypothetical protein
MTTPNYFFISSNNPINLSHNQPTKTFSSFKIIDFMITSNEKEDDEKKLPEIILIECSEIIDDNQFCFKYNDKIYNKVVGFYTKSFLDVDNKCFFNFSDEHTRINFTNQISLYLKDLETGEIINLNNNNIYINFNLV